MGRIVIVLLCVCFLCVSGFSATIIVDLNGGGDFTEIQPALDAAEDGDEVLVKPGEYVITEPINFNRLDDPGDAESPPVKDLVLRSEAGAEVTTIRMSETPANPNRASVVIFENGESEESRLEGFTLTGGKGTLHQGGFWRGRLCGGGVYGYYNVTGVCGFSPVIKDCHIVGNSATFGGGVWFYGWAVTFDGCEISDNLADDGGGAFLPFRFRLVDCTISRNSARGQGGGVKSTPVYCPIREAFCSICPEYCLAFDDLVHGRSFTNCTIENNIAQHEAGAVVGRVYFKSCTISGNRAFNIHDRGEPDVFFQGGGIVCYTSILEDCTISRNRSTGRAAGVFSQNSTLLDCTISENVSELDGRTGLGPGGLLISGGTVVGCEVNKNLGGGVESRGSASFFDCSISENTDYGVHIIESPAAMFTNCQIFANQAWQVQIERGSTPHFDSCTIVPLGQRNCFSCFGLSPTGAGCSAVLSNCIVVGLSQDPDPCSVGGLIMDNLFVSFSCVYGSCDCCSGEGNINADPRFVNPGVLGFNYAPTMIAGAEFDIPDYVVEEPDFRLLPDSPCIDTGTPEGARTTDIEGNPRPCGAGVDMGAYEFQTEGCEPQPAFSRGNADAQGILDISDGIFVLNFLFLGGPEPACMDAADTDDSGVIDISDAVGVFNFLFLGSAAPSSPYPDCGIDPTLDALDCVSFPGCGG